MVGIHSVGIQAPPNTSYLKDSLFFSNSYHNMQQKQN